MKWYRSIVCLLLILGLAHLVRAPSPSALQCYIETSLYHEEKLISTQYTFLNATTNTSQEPQVEQYGDIKKISQIVCDTKEQKLQVKPSFNASVLDPSMKRKLQMSNVDLTDPNLNLSKGCENVQCVPSQRTCASGTIKSCTNLCMLGQCTGCTPRCNEVLPPPTNYLPKAEKGTVVNQLPCIYLNSTEYEIIEITKTNLSSAFSLPGGFSVIIEPFTINCQDETVDLTISVPSNYQDIKALRCGNEQCQNFQTRQVETLRCGERAYKKTLSASELLPPDVIEVNLDEVRASLSNPLDPITLERNLSLAKVIQRQQETSSQISPNQNLLPVGNTYNLEVSSYGSYAVLDIPYQKNQKIDESSIVPYIKTQNGWEQLPFTKKEGALVVNFTILPHHITAQKYLQIQLMGTECIQCGKTSLEKVYEPLVPSRDAVIMVHGLFSSALTYEEILNDIRLTHQPFQAWVYSYPYSEALEPNAKSLAALLQEHADEYDRVFLVGHSLGGIIIQRALSTSYNENVKSPGKYSYLDSIKKVILIATPNEGSPVKDVYRILHLILANQNSQSTPFNPEAKIFDDVSKGIITPRLPGVEYFVIAGTKTYEFNLGATTISTQEFFGNQENDGVITTKSASHIGDDYIDDFCSNYWEINQTHTDILNNIHSRKIIEKIVSRQLRQDLPSAAVLGQTKYFDIEANDCIGNATYVVIGKKSDIIEQEPEKYTCECGNKNCESQENLYECPSDCGAILTYTESHPKTGYAILAIALLLLYSLFIFKKKMELDKYHYLVEHTNKNFNVTLTDGVAEDVVRRLYRARGWPKAQIDKAIKAQTKEFLGSYNRIREIIREEKKMGRTTDGIRSHMREKGYPLEMVEHILSSKKPTPLFHLKSQTLATIKVPKHPGYFFRVGGARK